MTVGIIPRLILAASLMAALPGCARNDVLSSGSNWHEDDTITRDIAAQLSNPADLVMGHGDATVPAQAFVAAIKSWPRQPAGPSANSGADFGGNAGVAGAP